MSFFNGDMKIAELNVGSDASGDMYYRNASNKLTRIPVGSDNHVLTLDGVVPGWEAASGGGGGASTSSANTFTETQSITKNKNGDLAALKIRNSNSDNGTNAIVSMRFDFSDSSGAIVESGKIAVKKNQEFLRLSLDPNKLTQDSNMVFSTCLNGTLTEQLTLDSNGVLCNVKGDKGNSTYVGSGFDNTNSNGSSICNFFINKMGAEIISTILIDITGLTSTSGSDTIIGKGTDSSAFFFQINPSDYNIIIKIELVCLVSLTGKDPATNLTTYPPETIGVSYSTSDEASGSTISGTKIINEEYQEPGLLSTSLGSTGISISSTTKLYLFSSYGSGNLVYNAGQFLVKIYGCKTL